MATMTTAAKATADQSMEMVPPSNRDSDTRGLLRRIMRRVREVMPAMVPDRRQNPCHQLLGHSESALTLVLLRLS